MSQSGRYLCINSPGDYYDIPAAAIVFDCDKALQGSDDCFVTLPYAATYNCTTTDGRFYAIGSRYSYYTGEYTFNYIVIDPEAVMRTNGAEGISEEMPGTVLADMKKIGMPYGVYINPYTGYIYATDAGEFVAAGALYQWSPEGKLLGKHKVYINPGHFLALPPDGHFAGITETSQEKKDNGYMYDLQGRRIATPQRGHIYIKGGKKYIAK